MVTDCQTLDLRFSRSLHRVFLHSVLSGIDVLPGCSVSAAEEARATEQIAR